MLIRQDWEDSNLIHDNQTPMNAASCELSPKHSNQTCLFIVDDVTEMKGLITEEETHFAASLVRLPLLVWQDWCT